MRFQVAIPNRIKAKISQWKLSPPLERLLYEKLRDDLGAKRAEELGGHRSVAPIPFVTFPFTLTDPESGQAQSFFFWVDDTKCPGTRIVIDCEWGEVRSGLIVLEKDTRRHSTPDQPGDEEGS